MVNVKDYIAKVEGGLWLCTICDFFSEEKASTKRHVETLHLGPIGAFSHLTNASSGKENRAPRILAKSTALNPQQVLIQCKHNHYTVQKV